MKVNNINGTSQNTCVCGTWLRHWEKGAGLRATTCSEYTCLASAEVGAHVQKDSLADRGWYIVPMCKRHNAKAVSLMISDSVVMISANVSRTCGA